MADNDCTWTECDFTGIIGGKHIHIVGSYAFDADVDSMVFDPVCAKAIVYREVDQPEKGLWLLRWAAGEPIQFGDLPLTEIRDAIRTMEKMEKDHA